MHLIPDNESTETTVISGFSLDFRLLLLLLLLLLLSSLLLIRSWFWFDSNFPPHLIIFPLIFFCGCCCIQNGWNFFLFLSFFLSLVGSFVSVLWWGTPRCQVKSTAAILIWIANEANGPWETPAIETTAVIKSHFIFFLFLSVSPSFPSLFLSLPPPPLSSRLWREKKIKEMMETPKQARRNRTQSESNRREKERWKELSIWWRPIKTRTNPLHRNDQVLNAATYL